MYKALICMIAKPMTRT